MVNPINKVDAMPLLFRVVERVNMGYHNRYKPPSKIYSVLYPLEFDRKTSFLILDHGYNQFHDSATVSGCLNVITFDPRVLPAFTEPHWNIVEKKSLGLLKSCRLGVM